MNGNRSTAFFSILLSIAIFSAPARAETQDPKISYLSQGQVVGERGLQVGDPNNWSSPIANRKGKSKSGKVTVAPGDFKGSGDAIQLSWAPRKKGQGNFGIYGAPIDLSSMKDAATLTIDLKVDIRPNKNVSIGMDCGYPCQASI